MEQAIYVELNMLCMMILILILSQSYRNEEDRRTETIVFNVVVLSALLIFTMETIWLFLDGGEGLICFYFN